MLDSLTALLTQHDCLYGLVCRDPTATDIELCAELGYHFVWLDLEHSPLPLADTVRLGRSAAHLGMVPLVRIPELERATIQVLLDGGIEVLILPDVRSATEVARFVELSKYPPLGRRGVSSTPARSGYALGNDTREALEQANAATHLMALIESDEGYAALDDILAIDGLDLVGVGLQDWGASLGIYGERVAAGLQPKADRVLEAAGAAGKIGVATVATAADAQRCRELGARVLVVGVDVGIKRAAMAARITEIREGR